MFGLYLRRSTYTPLPSSPTIPRSASPILALLPILLLLAGITLFLQSQLLEGIKPYLTLNQNSGAPPTQIQSGWFHPGGILQLDANTGLETKYNLLVDDGDTGSPTTVGGAIVSCDEMEEIGNGSRICVSDMSMISSLLNAPNDEDIELGQSEHAAYHMLCGLAGKRILLIGDSVDRYIFDAGINRTIGFFGADMPLGSKQVLPFGSTLYTSRTISFPVPTPSSYQSTREEQANFQFTPRYSELHRPENDRFRVDFIFVFGMDEEELFQDKYLDGKDVIGTNARIQASAEMWGNMAQDGRISKYDAIVISFGLWDLAGYQRKAYLERGNDDTPGLSLDWLDQYHHRFLNQIEKIRELHGQETPIFIRTLHNARPKQSGWFVPPGLAENVARTDAFPLLRITQLREAQKRVARALGVGLMPFADMMLGQKDDDYLRDDIHPKASASLVYWEVLLRMASEMQR